MAFRELTHKEQDKAFDKMVQIARKWYAKGYDLKTIEKGIWNNFGYLVGIKDGKLLVSFRYHGKNQKSFDREVTFE